MSKAILSHASGQLQDLEMEREKVDINFIKQVFKEVIENLDRDEKIISQYFSPHYIQFVDGHKLNYNDFVQHMLIQKTLLESATVFIEHCVSEGNKICTLHRVDAVKKNGASISVKVIAYFEIEDGKIISCDELTHILKGEKEDQSIGSIK